MRWRGIAPRFLPPLSGVFAGARDRYIAGLTRFRGDDVAAWIEQFATATIQAARLASAYVTAVRELQNRWILQLGLAPTAPRADAPAWSIIDLLPAHPLIPHRSLPRRRGGACHASMRRSSSSWRRECCSRSRRGG